MSFSQDDIIGIFEAILISLKTFTYIWKFSNDFKDFNMAGINANIRGRVYVTRNSTCALPKRI